jgi:two-component system, LuxR family, response regulator FixJ
MPEDLDVVLVVDDAAVRGALKFLLEVEGLTVALSDSFAAASNDPRLTHCRCIVVDNGTATMEGIDLEERLRARRIATPVILLASLPNAELLSRCAKAGIHKLVQMPVMDQSLLEALALALGSHTNT